MQEWVRAVRIVKVEFLGVALVVGNLVVMVRDYFVLVGYVLLIVCLEVVLVVVLLYERVSVWKVV